MQITLCSMQKREERIHRAVSGGHCSSPTKNVGRGELGHGCISETTVFRNAKHFYTSVINDKMVNIGRPTMKLTNRYCIISIL